MAKRGTLDDNTVWKVEEIKKIPNSDEARKLTAAAKDGMDKAIALCRDGALFWEIGDAIQTLAEERGFSVVVGVSAGVFSVTDVSSVMRRIPAP